MNKQAFQCKTFQDKKVYLLAILSELEVRLINSEWEIWQIKSIIFWYDNINESSFLDSFYDIVVNMIQYNQHEIYNKSQYLLDKIKQRELENNESAQAESLLDDLLQTI